MTKYRKRVVRSMMTRRYLSKISYLSGVDKNLLNEAFLEPLKRRSKTKKVLYSKRSYKRVFSLYRNLKVKDSVVQRRKNIWSGGLIKQTTSYYVRKKSGLLIPYTGKLRRQVESDLHRKGYSMWLKKWGKTSFKQIQQQEGLSDAQLSNFKSFFTFSSGFNQQGKMSQKMGYMYKMWLEEITGEKYEKEKHSYGSSLYEDFKEEMKAESFYDFAIKYSKELGD